MIEWTTPKTNPTVFPSNLSKVQLSTSRSFLTNMPEQKQVKFNGSRRFVRGSETNILTQSTYREPKTSVKCTESAYIDNIKNPPNPQNEKFLQTKKKVPERPKFETDQPRVYGDFGATKNRLKIVERKEDSDPITQNKIAHNHSTSSVWQEDRKQRDNGAQCKTTLEWNPDKKGSTYLAIHKMKCKE